ncbi:Os02g0741400, partial [Oryza sativa Japonica Group]
QERKQVEESIEKHRQAVKEVIEHYTGISSQIPSGSAIDEQLRSYFLAIKAVEESPSPFQDGAASQTPSVESADVDASAATAGRQVATPPRPAQVKVVEERAVSTLPKPSTEVRRPGGRRPLVRPSLERVEEPQADIDTTVVEGSTEKGGLLMERETPGGVSALQPSSRKRLIPSPQTRDDASQGETTDANPPLKKPKEGSSQCTSELKTEQSPHEDVMAPVPVLPSTELDEQQPGEEMDTDQSSLPVEEVEETREDDLGDKDDMETHIDASMDIQGQDAETGIDNDATTVEDVPVKSEAVMESLEEDLKTEDGKEEGQFTATTDVEDEREEGELPDEPEQPDSTPPVLDVGEQAGDSFRAASPAGPTEKSDVDMPEETGEGDGTMESDQSPVPQSGGADASPSQMADASPSPAREPSPNPVQAGAPPEQQNPTPPNPVQAGASSEQQNPATAAEGVETRSTRTINLTERARQNRQARILRSATQQNARGRGNQSLTYRKDGGRGTRGRGGRGQS